MSREFLPTTGAGPITCEPSTRPDSVDAEAVVVFMAEGGVGGSLHAEVVVEVVVVVEEPSEVVEADEEDVAVAHNRGAGRGSQSPMFATTVANLATLPRSAGLDLTTTRGAVHSKLD